MTSAIASATKQAQKHASIIVDHRHTNIGALSLADIQKAKATLHIVYGHTSHGGQLAAGMTGLISFANNGGKGLSLPHNTFAFGKSQSPDMLDLNDRGMPKDCGYFPDWVAATRQYLSDPGHAACNVVMWSWCGQVSHKFKEDTLQSEYLSAMAVLEAEYPHVTFVYMTGHLDHAVDEANKGGNNAIREHCRHNGRVLYDFADIESYDPDGTFYPFANDACDFFENAKSPEPLGNWAIQWQDRHQEGVDWFNCPCAHSHAINANQKAFAAWSLFVEIARRHT